jgi:hypothetical protein
MKALFTSILLVVSLAAVRPVEARLPSRCQLPLVFARPAVRPLTRYLAAVLHLTPKQATAVQRALRNCPAHSLAPEDLTLSLSPVLTPEAQERLQSLQNNATNYRALYYLAARH